MAAQEDEIKSLTEKNNELVQKVQYWKITAAERENEKLELMKEINELRLKVIRLKSGGAAEARKLEAALESASKQAIDHLVQASSAVLRTMELAKTYMREREGADTVSPRWSSISNATERVHRVPPMMIGGQSIQPVVSLSRAALNINNSRQTSRSPNSSRNVTVRAVPMHMLQDLSIPLTRIDMRGIPNNNETEPEAANDSGDNIPFDTSMEDVAEEPQNMANETDYNTTRGLDIVTEDEEPESEELTPPRRRLESPLEGPSWLLDAPPSRRAPLEPDSTTTDNTPTNADSPEAAQEHAREPSPAPRVFTPTLRRRKRSASPPASPAPPPPPQHHKPSGAALCSRVLQVLVPKLVVGAGVGVGAAARAAAGAAAAAGAGESPPAPCKRRFDAPSPNGATQRVIVSEEPESQDLQSGEPQRPNRRDESHRPQDGPGTCRRDRTSQGQDRSPGSPGPGRRYSRRGSRAGSPGRRGSRADSDSDSSAELAAARTRRNRKPVVYKEKPLNRKLRR